MANTSALTVLIAGGIVAGGVGFGTLTSPTSSTLGGGIGEPAPRSDPSDCSEHVPPAGGGEPDGAGAPPEMRAPDTNPPAPAPATDSKRGNPTHPGGMPAAWDRVD